MIRLLRRVRDWFRVVLPGYQADTLLAVVGLWCLLQAFRYLVYDWWLLEDMAVSIAKSMAVIGGFAYSTFRIWYFHPLENQSYGEWLETTGWQFPQKLPLGPLHLTLQDLVVIGVLCGMYLAVGFGGDTVVQHVWLWSAIIVTCMFAHVRGIFAWLSAVARREPIGSYGIALLSGLALHLLHSPTGLLLVAVAVAVVVHLSVQQLLRRFHDEVPGQSISQALNWLNDHSLRTWPAERLLSDSPRRLIPAMHAVAIAATFSWTYASFAQLFQGDGEMRQIATNLELIQSTVSFPLIILVLGRVMLYCSNHGSPVGFLGRFSTGRWIVPGYDQVFVAPLVALAIGGLAPYALDWLGVPYFPGTVVCLFLCMWAVLGIGPTLEDWRHTGHHHTTAGRMSKRLFTTTT